MDLSALDEIEKTLSSLDTDWERRCSSLRRLATISSTVARPENASSRGVFVQRICTADFRRAVALQCKDPRSAVIKVLAETLSAMSAALRESLDPFVDAMVDPLMGLLNKRNHVMIEAAKDAMQCMLRYSRVCGRGLHVLAHYASAKESHPQQRQYAMEFLTVVMNQASRYPAITDKIADEIQEALRRTLEDGVLDVRKAARSAFVPFSKVWRARAVVLKNSLPPSQRKYLGFDDEAAPPQPARANPRQQRAQTRQNAQRTQAPLLQQQKQALPQAVVPTSAQPAKRPVPSYTAAGLGGGATDSSSKMSSLETQDYDWMVQQQQCGLFTLGPSTVKKQSTEPSIPHIVPQPICMPLSQPEMSQDLRSAVMHHLEESGMFSYTNIFANNVGLDQSFRVHSTKETTEEQRPPPAPEVQKEAVSKETDKRGTEDSGKHSANTGSDESVYPLSALSTVTIRKRRNIIPEPEGFVAQAVKMDDKTMGETDVLSSEVLLQSLQQKDWSLFVKVFHSDHASERLRGVTTLNEFFENMDESQKQSIDTLVGELGPLLNDESADVVNATLTLLTTLIRRFTDSVQPLLQCIFPTLCRKLSATIIPKRQRELLDSLISVLVSQIAFEILLPLITDMMTSDDVHLLIPCLQLYEKCLKERQAFFEEHHRIIPHIYHIIPLVRFSNARVSSLAKSLVLALYNNSCDAFVSAVVAQPVEVFKRFREILQPIIPTFEQDLQRRNMSSGRFLAKVEPAEVKPPALPSPALKKPELPDVALPSILPPSSNPVLSAQVSAVDATQADTDPSSKACSGVPTIDRTLNSLKLGVEAPVPQLLAFFNSILDLLHGDQQSPLSPNDLDQIVDMSCKAALSDNKELRNIALTVLKELVESKIDDKLVQKVLLTVAALKRKLLSDYDTELEELLSGFEESYQTRDPQAYTRVLIKILQDPGSRELDLAFALDTLQAFSRCMDTMYLTVHAASIVSAVSPLLNSRSTETRKKALQCFDSLRNSLGDMFAPFLRLMTPKQLNCLQNGGVCSIPETPSSQTRKKQRHPLVQKEKPRSKGLEVRLSTPPKKQPKTTEAAVVHTNAMIMPSPIRPRRKASMSGRLSPQLLTADDLPATEEEEEAAAIPETIQLLSSVPEGDHEEGDHQPLMETDQVEIEEEKDTEKTTEKDAAADGGDDDDSIVNPPSVSDDGDSSGSFCPSPPSDSSDY